MGKIEAELNSFSKWFRLSFFAILCVYLGLWLFTIQLSNIQQSRGLEPVLPVVPQDSEEYRNLAESIISGNGFIQNGQIDTLRTPGYPSFVALVKYVGGSYFDVTLIQIMLVFFSAVVIRRLGVFFHSQRVGEIASFLFILNPLVMLLSLVILTDILFLSIFVLGFYLAASLQNNLNKKDFISKVIIISLIFAYAIYVRPMGAFALPIFGAPFLVSRFSLQDKIKAISLMVFVVLLATFPWVYRNYKLTGVASFTSFKAINLAAYAAPMFLAHLNGTTLAEERVNIEKKLGLPRDKWAELRYSREVSAVATKIILEHPVSYLKYHLISSLPFLFSSSIQDAVVTYKGAMHISSQYEPGAINYLISRDWGLFFQSISKIWWKMLERIVWVFVYITALFGLWKTRKNIISWVFIFIPLYLMILAGPAASARYAVQGLPFIMILFSVGLINLINKFKTKNV